MSQHNRMSAVASETPDRRRQRFARSAHRWERASRGIRATHERFIADLQGGTAVQAIVLLPAILFGVIVAFKLWEAVDIRKDLHQATYVATRYLSLYPPDDDVSTVVWEDVARKIIEAELRDNPFVDRQLNEITLRVDVTLFDGNECGDEFVVDTAYTFFAPVGADGQSGLPNLAQFQLRESIDGQVVCQ